MTPSLTATITETPTASPTWIETLVATITGETLTPTPTSTDAIIGVPTLKPDDALTATPGATPTFPVMPGIELTPALAFPSPEALALDLEPEQPLPVLESTDFRDPHDVDWEFTEPVMEPSADGTYWLHFRTPYAVRARLPDQNNVTLTLNLRMTGGRVSIRTHYTEGIGYYRFSLSADGLLELARGETVVASVRLVPVQPEHWRSLRLAVTGRSLRASIDGAMVLHYVDRAPLPPGQVWMAVDGIPSGEVWIDNVQMTGSTPRTEIAPPPIDMSAASMNLSPFSTQPVIVFDYFDNQPVGDHDLYRINPDGSSLTALPQLSGSKDYDPVLSPNGTEIAFSSWRNGNIDIWVMKTDGTNLRPLTNNTQNDYSPVWSPDGTKIAFVSDRGGITRVYTMNSVNGEAGGPAPLLISTGRDPAWSPNGNELAIADFNAASQTHDLYIVFLNTGGRSWIVGQVEAGGARAEVYPTWSPDGAYILFTSIIYVGTEPQFTLRRVERNNASNIQVVSSIKDAQTADYAPDNSATVWRLVASATTGGFQRAQANSPFTHIPDQPLPQRLVPNTNGNTFNPDWGGFGLPPTPVPPTPSPTPMQDPQVSITDEILLSWSIPANVNWTVAPTTGPTTYVVPAGRRVIGVAWRQISSTYGSNADMRGVMGWANYRPYGGLEQPQREGCVTGWRDSTWPGFLSTTREYCAEFAPWIPADRRIEGTGGSNVYAGTAIGLSMSFQHWQPPSTVQMGIRFILYQEPNLQPGTPTATPCMVTFINAAQFVNYETPTFADQIGELTDMQMFDTSTGTRTGLSARRAPTINADFGSGVVAWGSSYNVRARIEFPQGSGDRQIWYNLTASEENWVPIRYDGLDYSTVPDPCASVTPPNNLTFPYDRRAAANYAIEHSYDYTINAPQIPTGYVTRRLSGIPFADFFYSYLSGSPGSTGSTMFVSQAVWAGGLPMTSGNPTSCDVTPTGSPGWRYCRNLNGASNPWDFHQEFVAYHTNFDVPGVPFVNFPTSILTGSNLGRQLTFAGCGTVQTDRISSGSSLTDSAGQDLEAYFEFNGSDLLGDRTGILKMFQGSKPIFNKSSIVVDRL